MPYTFTTDPSRLDIDAIHRILSSTYWSPGIRRDVVETAVANSIVCVAIEQGSGQTVGIVRAATDYATFAWLCDVFVEPDHRRRGLARRMITELEAHPRLKTLRRWCLATRDGHSLYECFGYGPVVPGRWLEKRPPASAWQEAGFGRTR